MSLPQTTPSMEAWVDHESVLDSQAPFQIVQQDIYRINLDGGPAIILTVLSIIAGIQILPPTITCLLLAFSPIPWIIYNDYTNFLNLGPGGLPSTPRGYLRIKYLSLFSNPKLFEVPRYSKITYITPGYYPWLSKRNGPRPTIAGIVPQRQIDQPGCPEMYKMLRISLHNLAVEHPRLVRIERSCAEKHGLALFARNELYKTCRGEIVHVRRSDRSIHLYLHPDDAAIVIEKGWGERHPLGRGEWLEKYTSIPKQTMMIYAPRDESELDIVLRIIEAANFWVSGELLTLKAGKEYLQEKGTAPG